MATRRVSWTSSAPTTEYYTDADLVAQDPVGNFSTVYYWEGAINRGNTSSFSNNNGTQSGYVAGAGGNGHGGTMPSGYGPGAQRWYDGPWGVNLGHDAAGNRGADTVQQSIRGWFTNDSFGSIGPYPRIPKRPSAPGAPVITHIMPTSADVSWAASTDNAGSTIDAYRLRLWTGTSATGPYVDVSSLNDLGPRHMTGLTPGTYYTVGVYAHNGSGDNGGYSNLSTTTTFKTIAPMHVRVAGIWKYAVPYVKVAGVWIIAQPYVKVTGIWKATG